ncbi:MAG: type II toxin-antitoxin system VapC family toxin [Gemmatimonadales bacterium]
MIVLDSSFLIAYHNTRDVHHAAAARAMVHLVAGQWGRCLLLEYVFLEVVTVLLARRGLATAQGVGQTLLDAREVDFVPCSDLFLDALDTFNGQREDRLSFTDAAIVTLARRHHPGFVATFDTDFQGLDGVTVVPGRSTV